jgi:hypothetical protein
MTSIGNYMALKQKTLASSIPARVFVFFCGVGRPPEYQQKRHPLS